ncbi:MAG: class I SAM-dependent methyltransferase [Acidimicrobiales bacterium]
MEGYDASTYGEAFADVYDEWYGHVSDVDATVDVIAGLADGGPVLELGVGTGRLAIPLAARGLEVHGIDASPAMVERLRSKPGGDAVHVTTGDFADATVEVPDGFAVALVAFNTLFNLATADAQKRCFASVARRLRPGGTFVVEAFVPDPEAVPSGGGLTTSSVTVERVVLQATMADPTAQTISGSTISITDAGIRLRPWHIRWATPGELDEMANAAGLVRRERWGGWDRSPHVADGNRHVTSYERPQA